MKSPNNISYLQKDVERHQKEELISFEDGPRNFCICCIDIEKSTNSVAKIYNDSIKLKKYYSLFLNTMGKNSNELPWKYLKEQRRWHYFLFP